MSENVKNNWAPGQVQNTVNTRAIKRELTPEDMCGTLVYLCAPESDFVTGQVLVVDGGAVMH
jgi:NAD(P)-dependent dehydrogenase (short-subunit alcohol dehydrogenase family)